MTSGISQVFCKNKPLWKISQVLPKIYLLCNFFLNKTAMPLLQYQEDSGIIVLLWIFSVFTEHRQQLPYNPFHPAGLFFNSQKISKTLMFSGNFEIDQQHGMG